MNEEKKDGKGDGATAVLDGQPVVSEDHLEDGTELGAVQIHSDVVTTIARLTALKVPGVVEMSGTLVDGLAGMIGKKSSDRGIRVDIEENTVVVGLHVILEYGVRIPDVAWQLQNDVRQAVEQMTGMDVGTVNVVVQGVRLPGDQKDTENEEYSS